jgi:hypothetical protein
MREAGRERDVMASLVRLIKQAAQSRVPSQVHVALILSGALAHLFSDDLDSSRSNADFVFDQGDPPHIFFGNETGGYFINAYCLGPLPT